MENYLNASTLSTLFVLVVLAAGFIWARKQQPKNTTQEAALPEKIEPNVTTTTTTAAPAPVQRVKVTQNSGTDDLLMLCVMARPGSCFVSYDLLQAITAAGLQFGAMNIFHYYFPTVVGNVTLFSLASATKPGEFDIDRMGDFSCTGLTLFMQMSRVPDPQYAFKMMLETAQHLADDLDGVLHADPRTPLSDELLKRYQIKLGQSKATDIA